MIRLICPSCRSRIHAKDELAGQLRPCPQCKTLLRVPSPTETGDEYVEAQAVAPEAAPAESVAPPSAEQEGLLAPEVPDRLIRTNYYLICDRTKVVANWENNGQGWMLKSGMGYVGARRNEDQLPNEGDFQLLELQMVQVPGGIRLVGLMTYQLAKRYALPVLARGDNEIFKKITGPGRLTRDQKGAVKLFILNKFMHSVWQDARDVLDFLSSADYTSPGVTPSQSGEPPPQN